jgi:hypothetical protein
MSPLPIKVISAKSEEIHLTLAKQNGNIPTPVRMAWATYHSFYGVGDPAVATLTSFGAAGW